MSADRPSFDALSYCLALAILVVAFGVCMFPAGTADVVTLMQGPTAGPAVLPETPTPQPTPPATPVPDASGTAAPDAVLLPVSRGTDGQSAAASPQPLLTYVINTNTRRFHLPDCSSVNEMKAKNRQNSSATREALIEQGYTPCGRCKP